MRGTSPEGGGGCWMGYICRWGRGVVSYVERMSVSWIRRMKGREVWAGYIITFSFFLFFVRLSYLVSAFVRICRFLVCFLIFPISFPFLLLFLRFVFAYELLLFLYNAMLII